MSKEIQAIVRHIDSTDVLYATNRVEELRKALAEKEQAAQKARQELEGFEKRTREGLQRYPELLAEFEAELIELTRRQEERNTRDARIKELRKQVRP